MVLRIWMYFSVLHKGAFKCNTLYFNSGRMFMVHSVSNWWCWAGNWHQSSDHSGSGNSQLRPGDKPPLAHCQPNTTKSYIQTLHWSINIHHSKLFGGKCPLLKIFFLLKEKELNEKYFLVCVIFSLYSNQLINFSVFTSYSYLLLLKVISGIHYKQLEWGLLWACKSRFLLHFFRNNTSKD